MSDHAVVNDVYPPAHTQNKNARCRLYSHTAYMCDKEWDQHANSFELYSELLPRKPAHFFSSMNEWRASASLHPNPLPTGNRAAHTYKHTANRLPRGSGGGLWRIGHLYYITGLQEQRARKRRKSEWRASPPHSLSLIFSSMSQRQSDSLDALRKRSMTSPRP